MASMKVIVTFFAMTALVQTALSFVAHGTFGHGNMQVLMRSSSLGASSYQLRSSHTRSLKHGHGLRMAEGDGMSAAEETAKRLQEQAAALRESARVSEEEIRPATSDEPAPEKPAPVIRPEDMAPKQKISNDMRDRLRDELVSQGADPNKSAGNPILIVAAVIGLLVIVGGQGIFY